MSQPHEPSNDTFLDAMSGYLDAAPADSGDPAIAARLAGEVVAERGRRGRLWTMAAAAVVLVGAGAGTLALSGPEIGRPDASVPIVASTPPGTAARPSVPEGADRTEPPPPAPDTAVRRLEHAAGQSQTYVADAQATEVRVGEAIVHATHARFTVTAPGRGLEVEVLTGEVIVAVGPEKTALRAGESWRSTAASPATAVVTKPARAPAVADALLRRALRERRSGRFKAAARHYRELLRAHPSSDEAGPARLALGQLYLNELKDPARAVKTFERSLAVDGGGALAPEAKAGLARARAELARRSP